MDRKEKFTPGRWEFDPYSGFVDSLVSEDQEGANYSQVCEVWTGDNQPRGDGYLIAAAPEMYEALKNECALCLLRDPEGDCDGCRIGAYKVIVHDLKITPEESKLRNRHNVRPKDIDRIAQKWEDWE